MGLPYHELDPDHTGWDTLCTPWGCRAEVFPPAGRGKSFGAEHPTRDAQRCPPTPGNTLRAGGEEGRRH